MKLTPEVDKSLKPEDFNLDVLVLMFSWTKKGTDILLGKCNLLVAKSLKTGEPVILSREFILFSQDMPISIFQKVVGFLSNLNYNEWFLETFRNSEIEGYDLRFEDIISFTVKNSCQLKLLLKKFKQGKCAEHRKERFWNYLPEYFIEELPQYVYMVLKDDSIHELKPYTLKRIKIN